MNERFLKFFKKIFLGGVPSFYKQIFVPGFSKKFQKVSFKMPVTVVGRIRGVSNSPSEKIQKKITKVSFKTSTSVIRKVRGVNKTPRKGWKFT